MVAGLALLLVFVLVWTIWLPGVVRRAIETRLGARGILVEIEDVDLALNGFVASGLKARGARPGLTASIDRLAIEVLAWRGLGASAVRTIDASGVKVRVDVSQPFVRELFARKPAKRVAADIERAPGPEAVRVRSMELTMVDASGSLVAGRGLGLTIGAADWSLSAGAIKVGGAPGETIELEGLRAQGTREGRRPTLTKATSVSALLRWAGEATTPSKDALPAAGGRTLARLRAAMSVLRPPIASADAPAPAQRAALWNPGAEISLSDMRVVRGEGADEVDILSGLAVSLKAEEGDAFRARLQAQGSEAGDIQLDLRVWPHSMRVEGSVKLDDVSLALFAPALPPLPFYELERTRVRAQLSLTAQGMEAIAGRGEVEIRDLGFASAGLARLHVGPISFLARGEGTWTPARRELSVAHADLEVGALRANGTGVLAWPTDGYRVDGQLQLSKSKCQAVLEAVPSALLDELSTVKLEGDFAAKLVVHVDAADLDGTKVDFDVDDGCRFVALPPLLELTRFQQPFMHRVVEPDEQTFEFETGPGSPLWTPIEMISPFMIQAAVAHEDGRFLTHHGFAEPEIAVALSRNLKARAFKFGASTITMQLVKNVFLHRDKLLSRKVQEAFITWWLEQQWDKRRILELYLNVIEYGPAIYGIRSAAWHYFGTIPMNLTPAQSAFLASILPSPKTMHVQYDAGTLSTSMKARMASFLRHMRARERIDEEALQFGLAELESFTFYRPEQAPPVPPMIRGTAQNPFEAPSNIVDPWEDVGVPSALPEEDGSFGP